MRLGVAHQPCRLFGLALDKSCSLLLLCMKNNNHSPRFVVNLMSSSSTKTMDVLLSSLTVHSIKLHPVLLQISSKQWEYFLSKISKGTSL